MLLLKLDLNKIASKSKLSLILKVKLLNFFIISIK